MSDRLGTPASPPPRLAHRQKILRALAAERHDRDAVLARPGFDLQASIFMLARPAHMGGGDTRVICRSLTGRSGGSDRPAPLFDAVFDAECCAEPG